eukprot:g972.t1
MNACGVVLKPHLPHTSSIRLSPVPRSRRVLIRNCASTKGVMSAKIIDGKEIAKTIREELTAQIQREQIKPGLAVILVGDRKDSLTYVNNKKRACTEVGIKSFTTTLPESVTESDLLTVVNEYNADNKVDGILVQLPLPDHINESTILEAISLEKDIDGFYPMNIGLLAMRNRTPLAIPCTPQGCMELLARENVEIAGKRAVVIGRSNIVGMPVALLLQHQDATVTTIHSKTPNPQEIARRADIIIAACGRAEMVTKDWIKEGAVVIDVGINAVDDPSSEKGYKLVGDVKFDDAMEVASLVTPVPGGVGPMTIAMLLKNTVNSALRRRNALHLA